MFFIIRKVLGALILFLNYITLPRPMQRSDDAQEKVIIEASSLSLYQFAACPFCVKTRRSMHRLNLPIELRDAKGNDEHRTELEQQGGRVKVPCLRIEEGEQVKWMYESKDIISYLDSRFA